MRTLSKGETMLVAAGCNEFLWIDSDGNVRGGGCGDPPPPPPEEEPEVDPDTSGNGY